METRIFYWTGVILWWCLMLGVASVFVTSAVVAPIYVFHRVRKVWWKWLTLGKFASTGWTQEQLKDIVHEAGIHDERFLETATKVLAAAEKIKKTDYN